MSVEASFLEDAEIDAVLAALARQVPQEADLLLDIRDAAKTRRQPSACVRCFFQLMAKGASGRALKSLRDWLEQHIEVVAHGVENPDEAEMRKKELERLPLLLEGNTMEDYCHGLMECFQMDRVYVVPRVEMEFKYTECQAERGKLARAMIS